MFKNDKTSTNPTAEKTPDSEQSPLLTSQTIAPPSTDVDPILTTSKEIDPNHLHASTETFIESFTDHLAEFAILESFQVNALTEWSSLDLPDNLELGSTFAQNYGDGTFAFINALALLCDKDSHRQTQNKIKASLLLLSSFQLFLFTYQNFLWQLAMFGGSAIAEPACAFAALIEWINAGIDLHNATQKLTFTGWLEDTIDQVQHIDKMLQDSKNLSTQKINELTIKRAALLYDIGAYARVEIKKDGAVERTIENIFTTKKISIALESNLKISLKQSPTSNDEERVIKIKASLAKNHKEHLAIFLQKGFNFAAMTCIAIGAFVPCPPLLALGIVFAIAAAIIFFTRNGIKLHNYYHEKKENRNQFFYSHRETASFQPLISNINSAPCELNTNLKV